MTHNILGIKNLLTKKNASRRTLLKAGASCAFLVPFLRELNSVAFAQAAPRKVVFLFFPHGTTEGSGFWPGPSRLDSLSGVLAPLNAFRNDMIIVGGLQGCGGYGHRGSNAAVLSGKGTQTADPVSGIRLPGGPTVDWQIARRYNEEPLVLGVGTAKDGNRDVISWSEASATGKRKPTESLEVAFRTVYGRDAVTGICEADAGLPPLAQITPEESPTPVSGPISNGSTGAVSSSSGTRSPEHSILDAVSGDIRDLKKVLPSWSRTLLDEQLEAVRALELQISGPTSLELSGNEALGLVSAASSEPCYATGAPSMTLLQRAARHSDLIVSALASGTRHTAVLQIGNASGDSLTVPGFGGYHGEIHNLSSGSRGSLERTTAMQTEIFKAFAYFVEKLANAKDATGVSLLDSTLVYICTDNGVTPVNSDSHAVSNACVVLINSSGDFATGSSITGSGRFGGMLVHAAQFGGVALSTLHGAAPTSGVKK